MISRSTSSNNCLIHVTGTALQRFNKISSGWVACSSRVTHCINKGYNSPFLQGCLGHTVILFSKRTLPNVTFQKQKLLIMFRQLHIVIDKMSLNLRFETTRLFFFFNLRKKVTDFSKERSRCFPLLKFTTDLAILKLISWPHNQGKSTFPKALKSA